MLAWQCYFSFEIFFSFYFSVILTFLLFKCSYFINWSIFSLNLYFFSFCMQMPLLLNLSRDVNRVPGTWVQKKLPDPG